MESEWPHRGHAARLELHWIALYGFSDRDRFPIHEERRRVYAVNIDNTKLFDDFDRHCENERP